MQSFRPFTCRSDFPRSWKWGSRVIWKKCPLLSFLNLLNTHACSMWLLGTFCRILFLWNQACICYKVWYHSNEIYKTGYLKFIFQGKQTTSTASHRSWLRLGRTLISDWSDYHNGIAVPNSFISVNYSWTINCLNFQQVFVPRKQNVS